jgi:hypothetical protein
MTGARLDKLLARAGCGRPTTIRVGTLDQAALDQRRRVDLDRQRSVARKAATL